MWRSSLLIACVVSLAWAGCGGRSEGSTRDGGTGRAGAGAGDNQDAGSAAADAGVVPDAEAGDANSDAGEAGLPAVGCDANDCQQRGGTCKPVGTGGPETCALDDADATDCAATKEPNDECVCTADCTAGARCFETNHWSPWCSNGTQSMYKSCLHDDCQTDADCGAGKACAPAGLPILTPSDDSPEYNVRHCIPSTCRADNDCTAAPGGRCAVFNPGWLCLETCSQPNVGVVRSPKVICVYPGDCLHDSDCPANEYCVLNGARARCETVCP